MKRRKSKNDLYFIAIVMPENPGNAITEYKQFFKTRYQVSRALNSPPHITLVAPFRWPLSRLETLSTSLRKFSENHEALKIKLEGFGAFPPRVIFAGVAENEPLKILWQTLTIWLKEDIRLGPGPDKRGFHPHVTIAFKDLTPEIFHIAWPEFKHKQLQMQFRADRLSLLKHHARNWSVFREFPFKTSEV